LISNIDWNAKGEILVATANNAATQLAVGNTNGQVLTVDSDATSGVAWKTPVPQVPVGSVFYMAASVSASGGGSASIGGGTRYAPSGYIICDGTTIPTSGTFQGIAASLLQSLRTFLSTTYGATGQLPNLVNRFAGYSAVPGTIDGSANATLVSHSHTATSSVSEGIGHNHNLFTRDSTANQGTGAGANQEFAGGGGAQGQVTTERNTTGITVSTSISTEGSSATNANLPPYYALAFIMRVS
jgi:microcystin-dependent protein